MPATVLIGACAATVVQAQPLAVHQTISPNAHSKYVSVAPVDGSVAIKRLIAMPVDFTLAEVIASFATLPLVTALAAIAGFG